MKSILVLTLAWSICLSAAALGGKRDWERPGANLLTGFYNMYQPHVIEVPGDVYPFKMYFFGWASSLCNDGYPGCDAVFLARSIDLLEWEVWQGGGRWDATGDPATWEPILTAGDTYYDQWHTGDPSVVKRDGVYIMAYTSTGFDLDGIPGGQSGDTDGNLTCIMGATSDDGIHWTKSSAPILVYEPEVGKREYYLPDGRLDPSYTGDYARPSLMWDEDHWRLWFDYWRPGLAPLHVSMGHAECRGDPMNPDHWTVTHDPGHPLRVNWINPDVVKFAGVYYSFGDPIGYPCDGRSPWTCRQLRGAVSRDGLTWFDWEEFIDPDPDTEANHVPELLVTRLQGQTRLNMFYSCQIGGDPYDYRYDRIRAMRRPVSPDDLFLLAEPRGPVAGDPLALTTRWAPPGHPAALFVVEAAGTPMNLLVALGTMDGSSEWVVRGTVPPGLGGLTLAFRAYAVAASGRVGDSTDEIVSFQ